LPITKENPQELTEDPRRSQRSPLQLPGNRRTEERCTQFFVDLSVAAMRESRVLSGGCACGAIRFRLQEPTYDTGWCHCRICQRVSGSAGMVFTTVAKSAYQIEQGAARLGCYKSTSFGERTYCLACGAPLTIHVNHQANEIDVTVGSLDDPNAVTPGFHIFVEQAPEWLSLTDGLPQFPALRPDTRGLDAGQTTI
jgi:hypothetical protein